MSRGRKPKIHHGNMNWEQHYNKNLGSYLQVIIKELGLINFVTNENAVDLLNDIKKRKTQRTKKSIQSFPEIKKEEIPFIIPSNWVWCRIGEIIEFSENLNIETQLSPKTLINYVDIDAIDNQNYKIRECKLRSVSELSSRARRVLKKDYIIYSLVRPYLNNIAIVEEEKINHIGSTGFAVFKGILINNEYLKCILLTNYVKNYYLDKLKGFNSPSISQEQFTSTLIPLPPLTLQSNILSFLSDLRDNNLKSNKVYFDKNIESKIYNLHLTQISLNKFSSELQHQTDIIKKLRQCILQDAVQGKLVKQNSKDEAAEKLLEKIKAEKQKLISEGKLKKEKELLPINPDEIPFELPKSWMWCRLGEVVNYGSSKKTETTKLTNVTWLLELEDIEPRTSLLRNKIRFQDRKSLSTKNVFSKGEVLYSKLRPNLDKVIIADENGVCSSEIIPIYCIEGVYNKYLRIYLKSPKFIEYANSKVYGMNLPRLGTEDVRLSLFPLPPLSAQERIVAKVEELMQTCDTLEKEVENSKTQLQQLMQSVLREAFEGKDIVADNATAKPKKCTNTEKAILAGHIINLTNTEDFGRVKFQKLLYLTEHHCKLNLGSSYTQNVAGPYDGKLITEVEFTLKRLGFYDIERSKTGRQINYTALGSASQLETYFSDSFGKDSTAIDELLKKFKKSTWEQTEIVATLYAVWNNRILKNETITDDVLKKDFLAWDSQKKKYKDRLDAALVWMKENQVVPDGWGKIIDKVRK